MLDFLKPSRRLVLMATALLLTWTARGRAEDILDADAPVEAPHPIRVSAEQIPELIADLDSDSFERRQRATVLLPYGQHPVIEPLIQVARTGSPEAAARAVRILETLYTSGGDEVFEAAGEALESLACGNVRIVAGRAEQVLQVHNDVREQRAITMIQRLGGVVKYDEQDVMIVNAPQPHRRPVMLVQLGSKWRGGDEGLKYVKRIENLPALYISRSKSRNISPVSDEALENLKSELPNLDVQERGQAYLGVRAPKGLGPLGCRITSVDDNTPADKAGLRAGDQILSFGGEETPDFETLVALIADYEAGDEVETEIQRGGQTLTVKVTLEGWKM